MAKPWLHPCGNRREVGVADADDGRRPNGTDKGGAGLQPTPRHSRETRRRVGSYSQRHTEGRNGVTPWRAPPGSTPLGAGVNRRRHGGRMAQTAKATGTARGEADVSPEVWKLAGAVGVQR